jgi:hypothetical protein
MTADTMGIRTWKAKPSVWVGLVVGKTAPIPHLTKAARPIPAALEINIDQKLTIAKMEQLLRQKIDGGSRNDAVVRGDTWLAFGA